jgi:hypothetical protein
VQNHASGEPRPDRADIETVRRVPSASDAVRPRLLGQRMPGSGGESLIKAWGHLK